MVGRPSIVVKWGLESRLEDKVARRVMVFFKDVLDMYLVFSGEGSP